MDRSCYEACSRSLDFSGAGGGIFHAVKEPWQETRVYNDPILWIPEAVARFRGKAARFLLDFRNFPFFRLPVRQKREIFDFFSRVARGIDRARKPEYSPAFPVTSGLYRRGLA